MLDRMRDKIRLKHYSIRTEYAYLDWLRRFVLSHSKRHPAKMGTPDAEAFLLLRRESQRRRIDAKSGKERGCFSKAKYSDRAAMARRRGVGQ